MAPKLPPRYETQIRLGRDGDVEEWLATDTSLDRPVLVRILESSASEERRSGFLDSVRAAAAAHHVGLSEVYAVGDDANPYSIVEWDGGVSLGDRLRAGDTVAVGDFLDQGPQLAAALATLHEVGTVHGSIDPASVGFAGNRPAKLGAFGRRGRYETARQDTAALAVTMRTALTGRDVPGIRPSQVAEGLPPAVDTILSDAEAGALSAETLAAQLRALPPEAPEARGSRWSWKWTVLSAVLVVLAFVVAALGATIDVDPESPFLFPAVPEGAAEATPRPPVTLLPIAGPALPAAVSPWEPPAADFPNAGDLSQLLDDSGVTGWSSGDFFTPLNPTVRLGIAFTVEGTPRAAEVSGSPGTGYRILWSGVPGEPDTWETAWTGTLLAGTNVARLPHREGGTWQLRITRLPETADGRYSTNLSMVRFLP